MSPHKNYVLFEPNLLKLKGQWETTTNWFLLNTSSNEFLLNFTQKYLQIKELYEFFCHSFKFINNIRKYLLGTLQISTCNNFANTGPIWKIQSVLKSGWWDLPTCKVPWVFLVVRYIALDHLTWNDPSAEFYIMF